MSDTLIEWCNTTINPIIGCSKCSPGCQHCYAEKMSFRLSHNPLTATKYAGVLGIDKRWSGQIKYNASLNGKDMPHRVPGWNKKVFIGSMGDMFHPGVDFQWLDEIFASILCDAIITNSHRHSFIMLTKRIDRAVEYFSPGADTLLRRWGEAGNGWIHIGDGDEYFSEYAEGQTIPQPDHKKHSFLLHEYLWPLPNFWLGVSISNQEEANEKIPWLLAVPAARHLVSMEPLLAPVTMNLVGPKGQKLNALTGQYSESPTSYLRELGASELDLGLKLGATLPCLDWGICGAETGLNKREMDEEWAQSLYREYQAAGKPFFFKKNSQGESTFIGKRVREYPL